MTDLLFGLGMIFTVFDDSKARTRRLHVVNTLTTSIARAQQHGPMMQTALEELKSLMHARAAWFRALDGDRMVVAQHIGISPEFIRTVGHIGLDDTLQQVFQQGTPMVLKTSDIAPPLNQQLKLENLNHVVLVPVVGKKSVIGTLALGWSRGRFFSPEDIDFLSTTANQLGMAVENLRLLEQILRSQRQWMNTFDSIQDLILAHDADFRVIKVNQALLQRLGQAPADVVGRVCERFCRARRAAGPTAPTVRAAILISWREWIPASAAIRWFPRLRIRSREARSVGPFTWCGTRATGVPRKKNSGCYLSRCRKACSWRRQMENCSTATMRSSSCSDIATAMN